MKPALSALFVGLVFVGCASDPENPAPAAAAGGTAVTLPTAGSSGAGAPPLSGGQPASGGSIGPSTGGTPSGGTAPSSGGTPPTLAGGGSAGQGRGGGSGGSTSGGSGGDSMPGGGQTAAGSAGVGGASGGRSSGGQAGSTTGGADPTTPVTLFIAGDSTVQTYADTASDSDQAGWGQMLGAHFNDRVTVENRAIGGRTARRFIDEGRLDDIADDLAPGDYLLVQFGTNDGNRTATYTLNGETIPYYLDPDTDFKTYLGQYIEVSRDEGATLVFVTPPPRNSAYCTGGNGTGAHAQAMRELGEAENVPVSDLNEKTVTYLMAICPAPTPEDFFLLRDDGSVDGTHFQENGARILAGFVADGLTDAGLPIAAYLK